MGLCGVGASFSTSAKVCSFSPSPSPLLCQGGMAEVAGTAAPAAAPPPPDVPTTSTADAARAWDGPASYPPPQAEYEEVVASAGLFMETLARLHSLMGTKFKVPRIGGKSLDLHQLFVEVTSRGGFEKVVRDRKWKDIIASFNFPSTITSASFVLRKYYSSLLYHYEQVYFFQNRGFVLDANQPAGTSVASESQVTGTAPHMQGADRLLQGYTSCPSQDGDVVTGKIVSKFDHGYNVIANIGAETLKGVLYHVPSEPPDESTSHLNTSDYRQKRSRKTLKDPSRPKSNRSGYNFFFAEQCERLKHSHSREESAIIKQIGTMWNNLTATEKEVYQEQGKKDKERYMREMVEYRRSSNASQPN